MVKRNANHNRVLLPVAFECQMSAGYRFEVDPKHPERIWQKHKPGPRGRAETEARLIWVDPFEVREQFWRAQGADGLLAFLNAWGIGWTHETDPVYPDDAAGFHKPAPIFLTDLLRFQEFTRLATAARFSKWQRLRGGGYLYVDAIESLQTLCQEDERMLVLRFIPTTLSQVILGTLISDKLAQNKYRLCERSECRFPFKVDVRRRRRFCCEKHRVAMAMRRHRRKKSRNRGKQT